MPRGEEKKKLRILSVRQLQLDVIFPALKLACFTDEQAAGAWQLAESRAQVSGDLRSSVHTDELALQRGQCLQLCMQLGG